jgi:hypothetical protein
MTVWAIILIAIVGITVFCQAAKHSWEQWYYGRLNRKAFEQWRKNERMK